ncbi:MAG TPA: ABC transporter ATP-binding protein [Acidimicrobiales bacterium]|nr:ABC transporter ATP-binding protein [Acidimicrobiales bacterium]
MIEGVGLSKAFGGRAAVVDVSLRVEPGEVVGFLGPNGAGKTTTMRMLLGILRPTSGCAILGGPCGYLPEVFNAYDALSVRSFLEFIARMKRVPIEDVHRVMEATAIADLARRPTGRLSKGQHQRLGLAQALLGAPGAYVLDEPTQGLDPAQVVDARGLVRRVADEGAAVLLSTHLLAEAAAVCDRVVVIVSGRVVAEEDDVGSTADLEARFLRLVAGQERS